MLQKEKKPMPSLRIYFSPGEELGRGGEKFYRQAKEVKRNSIG